MFNIKKYMFLNSACTKTGKPDAPVTEAQPLAKARNKKKTKKFSTLRPDLKKIYMYLYVYQTSVCP